jgi:AAA domain, putative AbiEii toxin, Type IV TA system
VEVIVYLTSFATRSLKCFGDVTLDFPSGAGDDARARGLHDVVVLDENDHAGWNVILGANATGKTTLLQAMAVSLIGPSPAMRLVSPASWVRRGAKHGELIASFVGGEHDMADGAPRKTPYQASFAVVGDQPEDIDGAELTAPQILLRGNPKEKQYRGLLKGPYAVNKGGWLVCGYGAFRRFTGGAEDDFTYEPGRVGRVASLFRESVALKRDLDWLPRLYARSLDKHAPDVEQAVHEYKTVRKLLDQLLPAPVQISDVDTQKVYFSAPGAMRVDLLELSDGYRSFLALVMDLLRQMADVFGTVASAVKKADDGSLTLRADGVVLIDEIDLHLHPNWQREIGPRLQEVFPRLQFIVSSHSPFIAQAATRDGLFVLRGGERDAPVTVIRPAPQVAGWTAEQILLSPLFGLTDTRDPETEHLLREHTSLRGKAKFDKLDAADHARLVTIELALARRLTAPGEMRKEDVDEAARLAADKVRRMLGAEAGSTSSH